MNVNQKEEEIRNKNLYVQCCGTLQPGAEGSEEKKAETPASPEASEQSADLLEVLGSSTKGEAYNKENWGKLPSWVRGDSLVDGMDVRMVDIGSLLGALAILAYANRNTFFK